MKNEAIETLINIGFGHSSGVAPRVWRYAKQLMDHACTLGLAKPFNFGRGKGKYITDHDFLSIAARLERDPQAVKIAARFWTSRIKYTLEFFNDEGYTGDIKRDSVFLADLQHELDAAGTPYTTAPPRWTSSGRYVSLRRKEMIAV